MAAERPGRRAHAGGDRHPGPARHRPAGGHAARDRALCLCRGIARLRRLRRQPVHVGRRPIRPSRRSSPARWPRWPSPARCTMANWPRCLPSWSASSSSPSACSAPAGWPPCSRFRSPPASWPASRSTSSSASCRPSWASPDEQRPYPAAARPHRRPPWRDECLRAGDRRRRAGRHPRHGADQPPRSRAR